MLETLPDDVLLNIGGHLKSDDHDSLRLVSNALSDAFAVLVLKSIRICITYPDESSEKGPVHLELLQWLADPSPKHKTRLQAIRNLTIDSLSPFNSHTSPENTQSGAEVEQEVLNCLRSALLNLTNVHKFTWDVQAKDPVTTHGIVAETVSTYQHLETMQLKLAHLTSPVLHHFRNLRTIRLLVNRAIDSDHPDIETSTTPLPVLAGLSQALAQSPELETFSYSTIHDHEPLLDQIFEHEQLNKTVLPLRDLALRNIPSPLPLLPHIGNLKSIHITGPIAGGGFNLPSFAEFWKAVEEKGVRLEDIIVDRIPSSLVDYLSSYSGLKRFSLSKRILEGSVPNEPSDDIDAERFHLEALPKHASTMEGLILNVRFEDKWCADPSYFTGIAQCTSLRSIGLCFGFHQLQFEELDELDFGNEIMNLRLKGELGISILTHAFFDAIHENCPLIDTIQIFHPVPFPTPDGILGFADRWGVTQWAIATWEESAKDDTSQNRAARADVQAIVFLKDHNGHTMAALQADLGDNGCYRYVNYPKAGDK
ncbi:hypothetical protein CVT24_012317 [Panaeolus cyanescens]|uniref:F-box domain-containing protein n=1 Tax=Panaeolus cyanescens TaxID=181874 RepID=A0A409W440_9AGAR|nr:hypothetical protein CVT24_012317 [Panaeolus cyanescens]